MQIQYIFLRSDLSRFSKGSLAAQACHASLKVCHTFRYTTDVQEYLYCENMTTVILKIVYIDINYLKTILKNFDYVEWIEKPENEITALALRPYRKEDISELIVKFKNFKLY